MPSTHRTMLIACIAIAGIPPLAGFVSKDEILGSTFQYSKILWIIGAVTAGLTAFYMFRLYFMTFAGEYRGRQGIGIEQSEPEHGGHNLIPDQRHLDQGDEHTDKAHGHHVEHGHDPHESPASMTGILWVLAILAIVGGFVGVPAILGGSHPTRFQRWLEPVFPPLGAHHFEFAESPAALEVTLMLVSVAIAAFGIFLAFRLYFKDQQWTTAKRLATTFHPIHAMLQNKYYVDEAYNATAIAFTVALAKFLALFDTYVIDGLVNLTRHLTVLFAGEGSSLFDKYIVDGAVNGVAAVARGGSSFVRKMQSGLVQNYALIMGGGIVLITIVYLFTKP
jgi:NADH:ubiquinone oxidoreductase subunit 5 (subunit L)/multisubunit Na+/H+ antiporter MnhA subunit